MNWANDKRVVNGPGTAALIAHHVERIQRKEANARVAQHQAAVIAAAARGAPPPPPLGAGWGGLQPPVRHRRRVLRTGGPAASNLSKGDLRRLARQGGIKRMHVGIYKEAGEALEQFLRTVLKDTVEYALYARRKTVVPMDVLLALKRQGKTLYGGGFRTGVGDAAAAAQGGMGL
jgi:histone H4